MLELDSPPSAPAPASRVPLDRYARWAGLAVGILATKWLLPLNNGEGALYAILTLGLCAVAGVLLGDVLTAPPRGAVRTAGLTPRRVRDYVPPRMTVLLLGLAAALIVLLITAAAVASRDDLGRAGRAFTVTCGGLTHSYTPWPGLYYGLPILASLALSTAACGDRTLAIVAAWGLVVSSALFGVAATVSGALMSTTCDGAAGAVGNWTVWPLGLLAMLTAPWCLFTIVSPRATAWRGRRAGTNGTGRR